MNPCAPFRLAALALMAAGSLYANGILGSKHDLSSTATPGSNQVCMYCHTPHNANNTLGSARATIPLWNRTIQTTKTYIVYSSPNLINQPDSPTKSGSAACLGCHDGTMGTATVYGVTGTDKHGLINGAAGLGDDNFSENCLACHTSRYGGANTVRSDLKFGLDLSGMHPISINYPSSAQSLYFRLPTDAKTGWSDVKLYNSKVECGSCHAVHDPTFSPFLRKSNDRSELCLTCHIN